MENTKPKDTSAAIGAIVFATVGFNCFIFSRIFALDFNFLANSLWYLAIALFPTIILSLIFGKKIYHYYLHKNLPNKNTIRLCTFFVLSSLWMILAALLTQANTMMDNRELKEITVKVESIELKTRKHSRNYVAIFEMPFNVSCCFIPETKTELVITDKEAESFRLGQSKLEIQYKEGYFRIPYLINKKFIP